MPKGGARPNSGPEKGAIYKPTIEKARLREALREYIAPHIERMAAAQIENACGLSHFFLRADDGTFTRVEDPDQIAAALNGPSTGYRIFVKDPSTAAFTDLMNRTIDLPAKPPEDVNFKGKFEFSWKG